MTALLFRRIGIRLIRVLDRLTQVIYRGSGGRIGSVQAGVSMLLLDSLGRKTGKVRSHCLRYQRDGADYLVVASNFGLPQPPAWYRNLKAHPQAQIQVGREHFQVVARTAAPAERARLWPLIVQRFPAYASYQAATAREIAVVILTPLPAEWRSS